MSKPLILFNPKLPKLTKNEKQVLDLLVEAGKLIVPIYEEQEKQAATISRADIEKAGKKDPAVLSPYTVVEKVAGKIIAIPYHIKYAKLLKPISDKLNQAAEITENKEFGKALQVQAKALLDGNYEKATATWHAMKPYILDISIGPLNHFDDRLFFGKASYHAWVGVIEKEGTDRYNNYKSVTLSVRRKAMPWNRIDFDHRKIKAKVLDVILFSGMMARTKFVGINLPMELKLVERYGSEATLFNQSNDLRMTEQILPTFNQIFSPAFREGFSKEDLRRGYLRAVALHELGHSYLYYKKSLKNLKDLFPCIYELAATTLGLRLAGTLLLKDRITEKMLKSMIVAFSCRSYYLMERRKTEKSMSNYALGSTVFINFMLESGALKKFKDLIVPNFTKVFLSLHELSDTMETLLATGIRKDAESFLNKYQ